MLEKHHPITPDHGPTLWTWLGRVEYIEALDLMESLIGRVEKWEMPGVLLFLEHPPVITLGRRADLEDVIATQSELEKYGCHVFQADRGGKTTCHGPGQLIGYFIVHLGRLNIGIRNFVAKIENVIINVMASMGVKATSVEGMPGVWVKGQKIAALGMRVKNHITSHGFALNVDFDLNAFDLVVPCGMKRVKATNLSAHLNTPPSLPELAQAVAETFGDTFGVKMTETKGMLSMTARPSGFFELGAACKKGEEAA